MAAVRKLSLIFDFILTINKSLELVKLNLVRGNLQRIQHRFMLTNGDNAEF